MQIYIIFQFDCKNRMIQIDSEFLYVEEKHEHDCKMKNVNVRKKRYFPSQTFKEIFLRYMK